MIAESKHYETVRLDCSNQTCMSRVHAHRQRTPLVELVP